MNPGEFASAAALPLRQARSGGAAALDELLRVTRPFLVAFARAQLGRRLQGKADPSDLAQEALLEIHKHFGAFRGDTEMEFSAWARSIMAGVIANHVRRYLGTKQRDARLELGLALEQNNSSGGLIAALRADSTSPSEQAECREDAQRLAHALARLPQHYREVIVLRHLQGLSFAEVAERMERSLDSVDKLWVRSLAQLRQLLRGHA